jgi:cytochrome c oxidase assembly factor CtaG
MLVMLGLVLAGWGYARGTRALWRAAGRGRGVRTWQVKAFVAGMLTVALALISPLDALADQLFSAHMGQHLLLMAIAAPMLALAGAQVAWLWALPPGGRVALGRVSNHLHALRLLWSLPVAFACHSLALWLWHAPPLYVGALHNAAVHALEHVVLLGSGVVFWSAAFSGVARGGRTPGASVLCVFAFGAQCTGLGALITLSARPWYTAYLESSAQWGLSPMDDQVLAGALMWVPAGFVYLGFALLLLGAWLRPTSPVSRAESGPPRLPPAHLPGGPAPH